MDEIALKYDAKVVGLAKELRGKEAEILIEVGDMQRLKLFAPLGYVSLYDYCERRLKLSPTQAYYFKMVLEKSLEVPEIKNAVKSGELSLSQARRIVPAVTKANFREWIDKAKDLRQGELEKAVTAVNPKAHVREKIRPVAKDISEMKAAIDATTEANLKALTDILSQKLKRPAKLSEVIAWMSEEIREKHDPLRKAGRARKVSLGNPPKPGRHPVKASVVHPVQVRDNNQCAFVGLTGARCEQQRWLQLHHIKEVSKGGLNTVDNLRLLCHAHHRLTHSWGLRS